MLILDNRSEITQDKMRSGRNLWGEGRCACMTFKDIFTKVKTMRWFSYSTGGKISTSIILPPHTHDLYTCIQAIVRKNKSDYHW